MVLGKELPQLVFVDVDLVVIIVVVVLLIILDNALMHHVVVFLTHVVLLLVHGLAVIIDILHLFALSHLFVSLAVTILILVLAVDHLSLVVLVLLLLDEHLVMLVEGNSLIALHAFFVVLILDFAFTLVRDLTLFIDLVHVISILVVLLVGVLAFRSLVISHSLTLVTYEIIGDISVTLL